MTERTVRLDEMTWQEAQQAIERADFVALPCGSTEQHSLHLPLNVDTIRADRLTVELAETAPDHDLSIVTLPALPYGHAEHHLSFAGTVSISSRTYEEFLVDIGTSVAAHDADRFLIVNAHLGNENAIEHAIGRLQRKHDLPTHYVPWSEFAADLLDEQFGDDWGHASAHETSVIEHYRPELVHEDKKRPPTLKSHPETRPIRYFDERTTEGGMADPTTSDPEAMAEIIEKTTDRILETLRSDIEIDG